MIGQGWYEDYEMKDKPKGGMNQKKKKVKHADVKQDKKMVKQMVKKDCLK